MVPAFQLPSKLRLFFRVEIFRNVHILLPHKRSSWSYCCWETLDEGTNFMDWMLFHYSNELPAKSPTQDRVFRSWTHKAVKRKLNLRSKLHT